VSVARLAEAHVDALAILAEAGEQAVPGSLYGVWASSGPADTIEFDPDSRKVRGNKPFSSGLGLVDRALITATSESKQERLLDVDVSDLDVPPPWTTTALEDTATGDAVLSARPATEIGEPGFYLSRPGFWFGAIGPAACWAGAASGLVDIATETLGKGELRRAAQGRLLAEQHGLETLLRGAGADIDRSVGERDGARSGSSTASERARAYAVRHLVERRCASIIDEFAQTFGPRPFVSAPAVAQRIADTQLYCRQHHGARDLAHLAEAALT